MAKGTKLWYNTHRGIMIPVEAHKWLIRRAGEQQTEKGHRVAVILSIWHLIL